MSLFLQWFGASEFGSPNLASQASMNLPKALRVVVFDLRSTNQLIVSKPYL